MQPREAGENDPDVYTLKLGSKGFALPFERMSTWEALGNPFRFNREKPTVIVKRTEVVVTRRTIWKTTKQVTYRQCQ